ncbi:hypothetical protein L0657_25630 [Dyadobacter sp. CY345]|uniref:hypothetical protein n=1 Tax=Dyadobacter sp. CY345 TaxID=2909335 RepID=UPI001F22D141|nr:hypothetical protein [Dyadobacter sp. CY345]MCF2447361.1 hypothetical protein [Dyadobacter sp. CY345]
MIRFYKYILPVKACAYVFIVSAFASATYAQQGSSGNTTIYGGAEMTLYGNHNFVTGGNGTQPGIVGTVRTAPFGVLNFASSASSHVGANDANHVDGYIRKDGSGSFIFPTGDNGHYGPFAAVANGTTGAYFFANAGTAVTSNLAGGNYAALPAGAPFNTATKAADLTTVSAVEYWDIDGATPTAITLTWSASGAISALTGSNLSKLTIAGWNGTQWVRIPSAVDVTSTLGGASDLTAGSITSTVSFAPNTYTAYTFAAMADSHVPFGCTTYAYVVSQGTGTSDPNVLSQVDLVTGVTTVRWPGKCNVHPHHGFPE